MAFQAAQDSNTAFKLENLFNVKDRGTIPNPEELRKSLFESDNATFADWDAIYRTNVGSLYFMTTAFLAAEGKREAVHVEQHGDQHELDFGYREGVAGSFRV